MKYAKKMIMVPYIPHLPDRETEQLEDFDKEMNKIVENNKLSVNDKVSRYNEILNKFISKNSSIENNKKHSQVAKLDEILNKNISFDKNENDETISSLDYVNNEDLEMFDEDEFDELIKKLDDSKVNKDRKLKEMSDYEKFKLFSTLKTRKQRIDHNARRVSELWPINSQRDTELLQTINFKDNSDLPPSKSFAMRLSFDDNENNEAESESKNTEVNFNNEIEIKKPITLKELMDSAKKQDNTEHYKLTNTQNWQSYREKTNAFQKSNKVIRTPAKKKN